MTEFKLTPQMEKEIAKEMDAWQFKLENHVNLNDKDLKPFIDQCYKMVDKTPPRWIVICKSFLESKLALAYLYELMKHAELYDHFNEAEMEHFSKHPELYVVAPDISYYNASKSILTSDNKRYNNYIKTIDKNLKKEFEKVIKLIPENWQRYHKRVWEKMKQNITYIDNHFLGLASQASVSIYYNTYKRHGLINESNKNEKLEKYLDLIERGIYNMDLLDEVAFVVELPKKIHREETTKTLHSTTNPTYEWTDKISRLLQRDYFLHGVAIPSYVWEAAVKNELTYEEALSIENMEIQRAVLSILAENGGEKFLIDAGAKKIDTVTITRSNKLQRDYKKGEVIYQRHGDLIFKITLSRDYKEGETIISDEAWEKMLHSVQYDLFEIPSNKFRFRSPRRVLFLTYRDPSKPRDDPNNKNADFYISNVPETFVSVNGNNKRISSVWDALEFKFKLNKTQYAEQIVCEA